MTTTSETNAKPDQQPDAQSNDQPDYEKMAASMLQQWQQQFLNPETLATSTGTAAQLLQMSQEMTQQFWQSWIQNPGASNGNPVHTTPDAAAADAPIPQPAATAAAPADGYGSRAAGASYAADAAAPASMASVALCAELARRLDLLSNRVAQLERQLEQQPLNRK